MKFSYNWLKELAKFKESPEKLAEFLMLRAFEVESVMKKGRDWVIEVKVLPNRVADASGHWGLAREIAALKNSKLKVKSSKLRENLSRKTVDVLQVKIENPDDCPRYTARVMSGVKVGPSPKWLRERLEVCGVQSINNIVDAANYVMLELGQPLHVFDFDKLKHKGSQKREFSIFNFQFSKTIIVRRARKGEKLLALDDKAHALSPEILVIADEVEPIAIAGIKGGEDSGVSAETKNVVLESANFDPVRIRLGSKALNLKTDASFRFEHGMDPNETAPAVDRLTALIQRVAGGEILAGRVDAYPKPPRPAKILLRRGYLESLVGETIPPAFVDSSLKRLGWKYAKKGNNAYIIEPPTARRDIQIEEDIIEEIVRLLGYEKIKAKLPKAHYMAVVLPEGRQGGREIKDILVGAGLTEVYVYEFIGRRTLEIFGESPQGLLELENPTNPDTQYLVNRPFYHYAVAAAENLRRTDAVSIFGLAKGFLPAVKPSLKTPAVETRYLNIAKASRTYKNVKEAEAFYATKGTIDYLLESLGISDNWYDDALSPSEEQQVKFLHPHRRAQIKIGDEYVGFIGELHPDIIEKLKARGRIVVAEILIDKLAELASAEAEFRPIGKFPAVVRDIAVVVPENTKTEEVTNVIEIAGGELLVDTDLFDYFQDEVMEENEKKSLAFHLVFQSPERTLTDEEVDRICKKINAAVKGKGWEVRE